MENSRMTGLLDSRPWWGDVPVDRAKNGTKLLRVSATRGALRGARTADI
jgi:hypothetical protein